MSRNTNEPDSLREEKGPILLRFVSVPMPGRLSIDFTIVSHLIHTSTPSSTRWANNGTTVTSYLRNVKIKAIGSISHT